jgi:hypothetical protein
MTQEERKGLWDQLLAEGWSPTKHYRDHSVQELRDNLAAVRRSKVTHNDPVSDGTEFRMQAELDALRETPADTVPGMRTNTHLASEKPIRIDDDGKIWYQDEIRKPGMAKERGKRHLTYTDPGVKTVHVRDANGSIVESFEMPGDDKKESRATIALPAYQIGLYRDPAVLGEFFKIHVYNEQRVFDIFDVERYFGGRHMIPATCKRAYADTALGYDIDSVIQAIQDEYREKVLKGEIKENA